MPRYFFHTRDGHPSLDEIGAEFPDDAAARAEAVTTLGEFFRYGAPDIWRAGDFTLVVQDEGGRIVAVLATSTSTSPPPDWPWRPDQTPG